MASVLAPQGAVFEVRRSECFAVSRRKDRLNTPGPTAGGHGRMKYTAGACAPLGQCF